VRALPSRLAFVSVTLGLLSGTLSHLHANCGREAILSIEVIREDGPWRCVEIPGFLVFTRLPNEHLETFTDELRSHLAALAVLRAPANLFRPGATQLPVILRQQPLPTVPVPDRTRPELLQPFEDAHALIYVASTAPGVMLRAGPSPVLGTTGTITAQPGGAGVFGQPRVPRPVSAHMLARDHLFRELKRRTRWRSTA